MADPATAPPLWPPACRPGHRRVTRGRGAPMNAGAALGSGDALLFLHADTVLPDNADGLIAAALDQRAWGRFDLRIAGRHPFLAVVARMINWRSRLTGIATGDQAIFVTREAFVAVGGFPDLPLMEDIALSHRLKRLCRPYCIGTPAVTSGRRWEYHGVLRTIASDVAAAACLLSRRRAGTPRRTISPGQIVTRARRRRAIAAAPNGHIAPAGPLRRRAFGRRASPNADHRGRRAPARPCRPCPRR